MKPSDLPLVTLDLRQTGAVLAHPCPCHRHGCTLGEHIWRSTRDMAPGPKAQTTEPRTRSWPTDTDTDDRAGHAIDHHATYQRLLTNSQNAARDLAAFIARHRPDRTIADPHPDPATDDAACRNHLDALGTWEPRSRGDLCNFCGSYAETTNRLPSRLILKARHEGRNREVDRLVAEDAVKAALEKKSAKKKKRRRAS